MTQNLEKRQYNRLISFKKQRNAAFIEVVNWFRVRQENAKLVIFRFCANYATTKVK